MPHITLCQKNKDSRPTPCFIEIARLGLIRHRVIRITFVIPVFAAIAFLSIVFNDAAIYLKPIEDLYEAFTLASFFLLLCAFVQESDEERQIYFTTSGTAKQHLVLKPQVHVSVPS
jgi:Organic solute transporter Ostalpha